MTLTPLTGNYQGGIWAGKVTLTTATGSSKFNFSLIQNQTVTFTAAYARREGELAEKETFALTPGAPKGVGNYGPAFKFLMRAGLDPFQIPLQTQITADLTGTATFTKVPPAIYRLHLLADQTISAVQPRGSDPDLNEDLGIRPSGTAVEGFIVAAQSPCAAQPVQTGPLSPSCLTPTDMSDDTSIDPATDLCATVSGTFRVDTLCQATTFSVPAAVATRQVDLVKFSDYKFCSLSAPIDGTTTPLNDLVARAQDGTCTTSSSSGWTWSGGGPACGSSDPAEAAQARFNLTPVGNLPIGTATYKFTLPDPNRDVVVGASFSYRSENALIYVSTSIGNNALTGDGPQGSILVAGDPAVSIPPAIQTTGRTGSARIETAFISSSPAKTGTITFVVIPTTWVSSGTVNQAHVELCNLGLEINTHAKSRWGSAASAPSVPNTLAVSLATKHATGEDVLAKLDPSHCRTRKRWDATSQQFVTLGSECEQITGAILLPKNNQPVSPIDDYSVVSGNPSHFAAFKRSDGVSLIDPLVDKLYDPDLGVTPFECNSSDATFGPVCDATKDLGYMLDYNGVKVNGRFFASLPITDTMFRTAAATAGISYAYLGTGSGAHALGFKTTGTPATNVHRYPVGTNYDGTDGLNDSSTQVLSGLVSVAAGSTLKLTISPPAGGEHTISSDLDCVTVDSTVVCP